MVIFKNCERSSISLLKVSFPGSCKQHLLSRIFHILHCDVLFKGEAWFSKEINLGYSRIFFPISFSYGKELGNSFMLTVAC